MYKGTIHATPAWAFNPNKEYSKAQEVTYIEKGVTFQSFLSMVLLTSQCPYVTNIHVHDINSCHSLSSDRVQKLLTKKLPPIRSKESHVQINETVPKIVWVFWTFQDLFNFFLTESSHVSLYWLSKIRYIWELRIYERLLRSWDTTSLKNVRNSDLWFLSLHLKIWTLQYCLKLIFISYYSVTFTHWQFENNTWHAWLKTGHI